MIGICGTNRPEWAYSDFVCSYYGFTSVPIHTKAGAHARLATHRPLLTHQMTTLPSSL